MEKFSLSEINDKIAKDSKFIPSLRDSIAEVIVGQYELIDKIIIGILANGHLLLEEGSTNSNETPRPQSPGGSRSLE